MEIEEHFDYIKERSFFHSFVFDGILYGLLFADESEGDVAESGKFVICTHPAFAGELLREKWRVTIPIANTTTVVDTKASTLD